MSSLSEWLEYQDACARGLDFARDKTPREAWETCDEPMWLLWALRQMDYDDQRVLRLFACRCARQVWHLLPEGPLREVVEVAERYAEGMATANELKAAVVARDAAWAVSSDAATPAANAAAKAAALAAADGSAMSSADGSAMSAVMSAAMSAARAASWEAVGAASCKPAGDAAWDAPLAEQANILRELVPWDVVAALVEKEMIE